MPVVILTPPDFERATVVPPALNGIVAPQTWNAICQSINSASSQAHMMSCGTEIGICVCFAFPCIFLCHPCLYMAFASSYLDSEINRINASFFNGQRVMTRVDRNVTFNTDFFVPAQLTVQPMVAFQPNQQQQPQAVYAEAVPMSMNPQYEGGKADSVAPVAMMVQQPMVIQQQQPRVMMVQVPNGAEPGQVMRAQAPNGTIVEVTIPPNAYAGQQLTVQY